MKIQYLSDLHLEFNRNIYDFQIPETDADVIVLAGDVGSSKPAYFDWVFRQTKGTPTVMVLGNHEHYNGEYHATIVDWRSAFKGSHVHVLENDSIEIDGVLFLGATLWTDYQFFGESGEQRVKYAAQAMMKDHHCISIQKGFGKERFYPDDAQAMHRQSLAFIEKTIAQSTSKKTVIVSHHAPSKLSIAPIYEVDHLNAAFASHLDEWMLKHKPTAWIHGHMHNSFDYMIGDTRVVCNPRGYAPYELNKGFNSNAILSI